MNRLNDLFRRLFGRCRFAVAQGGIVATEFALALPIWITLLLGAADTAFLLIVSQRVDRIAYSVTDIVTQSEMVTIGDLNNILLAAGQLMQPFPFGENGLVVVSSVYKPAGQPMIISWQYSGGGTLARASAIGVTGGVPNMPNSLTLNDNENVIIAEVYYSFEPLFINAGPLAAGDLYRVSVYKPRLSPLITPPT